MPSSRRHLARCLCLLLGITAAACSESNFPVTPTPTAQTPLVTLQTASYQGTILDGAGQVTFFNMTLIARSLGATFALSAQAPGTTIVSGLFETGTGIEGTVEGTVSGTLQNGTVQLTLAVVRDGCTEQRIYTGIVTDSGVALTPGERTHSCPANTLTFAVQAAIPTSPTCSYSVSPVSLTISGNGGSRSVEVTTRSGCPWVAETGVPWLALTSQPTGSGSGSVVLMAQVNDGAARSGTARVAGQTITVAQGPQCSIAIAPTSARVPAAGGTSHNRCHGGRRLFVVSWEQRTVADRRSTVGRGVRQRAGGGGRELRRGTTGHRRHRRPVVHRHPGRGHAAVLHHNCADQCTNARSGREHHHRYHGGGRLFVVSSEQRTVADCRATDGQWIGQRAGRRGRELRRATAGYRCHRRPAVHGHPGRGLAIAMCIRDLSNVWINRNLRGKRNGRGDSTDGLQLERRRRHGDVASDFARFRYGKRHGHLFCGAESGAGAVRHHRHRGSAL